MPESAGTITDVPAPPARNNKPSARLGEELPVFCERCGYSLHGLPQVRCDHCQVLQFHCPECGHHQPINTLRPAAQKILGRMRAWALAFGVFIRINFFFWVLLAWFGLGNSIRGYNHRYFEDDLLIGFGIFALSYGIISRMLLLRWRRGFWVGLVLAATVLMSLIGGMIWRRYELRYYSGDSSLDFSSLLFTTDWPLLMLYTAAMILLGACLAWPLWMALVRLFLPKRAAAIVLDWQRSLSTDTARLSRE